MTIIKVGKTPVDVSNLTKTFYPACGFTKGDVLAYYNAIAPIMLPHLAKRPVSLKRYPDGIDHPFFFEKRCPSKHPSWVDEAKIHSSTHGSITFCVINNAATLVWMANRAALEFHTYLFCEGKEDSPTMLVFDLDPGPSATLTDCLDIGVVLHDLLAQLGLKAFAKTSGSKGLHVAVPLRGATFAQTKSFAHLVAEALAREEPKRVTSRMAKSLRKGRVFIDWSQNDHGKTTACAYTLRAGELPGVSTPVSWDEIGTARRKNKALLLRFSPQQVLARVKESGDLFAPTLSLRQKLPEEYENPQ